MLATASCPTCSLLSARHTVACHRIRQPAGRTLSVKVRATQGPFDEGADQVRRLLNRDRKELSNFGEIGGGLKAEFDEGPDAEQPSAKTVSPFAKVSPAASNPFSAVSQSQPVNPFGSSSLRKPIFEPEELEPNMSPIPISTEPWWKKITITQVVIALSFLFSIVLMLATFAVVVKSGGVHFNED